MASSPVLDGAAQAFLSPGKKMLVMCGTSTSASPTFVLFDAVLAVPEGDITMYDGSASQWNNYSVAKIQAAGATDAQADDAGPSTRVTPGTSALRAVGALPAAVAGREPVRARQLRVLAGAERGEPDRERRQGLHVARRAAAAAVGGGGGGGSTGGGC